MHQRFAFPVILLLVAALLLGGNHLPRHHQYAEWRYSARRCAHPVTAPAAAGDRERTACGNDPPHQTQTHRRGAGPGNRQQACQLGRANDLAGSQTDRLEMLQLRRELIVQLARSASLQEKARSSIYDGLLVNRLEVGSLGLGVPIHLSSADFELLQQTSLGVHGFVQGRR